jgi:selenium-binding protein 1
MSNLGGANGSDGPGGVALIDHDTFEVIGSWETDRGDVHFAYDHLDFWSLSEGKLIQRVDLGDEHQMVLELRPAHDPRQTWGFVGVVISVETSGRAGLRGSARSRSSTASPTRT